MGWWSGAKIRARQENLSPPQSPPLSLAHRLPARTRKRYRRRFRMAGGGGARRVGCNIPSAVRGPAGRSVHLPVPVPSNLRAGRPGAAHMPPALAWSPGGSSMCPASSKRRGSRPVRIPSDGRKAIWGSGPASASGRGRNFRRANEEARLAACGTGGASVSAIRPGGAAAPRGF